MPLAATIAALTLEAGGWAAYSAVTAAASGALFIAFGVAWEQDHARTGILQRVTIVVGWAWLAALCRHLAG